MKECKKCNKTFENTAIYCPICGEKLEEQVPLEFNKDQCEDDVLKDIQSHLKDEPRPLPPDKVKVYVIKKKFLIIFGLLVAILPFFITGFSFSFMWYILIACVLFIIHVEYSDGFAIENATDRNMYELNVVYIILFIIAFIMYMWGPLNPKY